MTDYALITGATGGIGWELAVLFGLHGYGLILVSSSRERLLRAKARLRRVCRAPVYIYEQDLAKPGAASILYDRIKADGLAPAVLVNNAGFGLCGPADETDLRRDEALLNINIASLVGLTKLVLADMYRAGCGRILNVSSIGAFQPGPYTASYFASKAFVLSYSRALACEARGKGVQVSALCPGTTDTGFFRAAGVRTPRGAMSAKAVARAAYRGLMAGREVIVPGARNKLTLLLPSGVKMRAVGCIKRRQYLRR